MATSCSPAVSLLPHFPPSPSKGPAPFTLLSTPCGFSLCPSVHVTVLLRASKIPKMPKKRETFLRGKQQLHPFQKKNKKIKSGTIESRRQVCTPTSVPVPTFPSQCASAAVSRRRSSLARCLSIPSSSSSSLLLLTFQFIFFSSVPLCDSAGMPQVQRHRR